MVLDSVDDFWGVLRQIDPASSELSLRHDVTVSAIPVSEDELANPESALLHSASREGVLIG